MMHSLRARLLLWLLLPLAAFMAVSGWMSYQSARDTANLLQDKELFASARTIGEDVDWSDGMLVADIPPAALEIFESPEGDQVFYKVFTGSGQLIGGTPELAGPPRRAGGQPVFYDTTIGGQPIRAVAYARTLYDSGHSDQVTVIVGKTPASRDAMFRALWHPQLIRQGLMLALAVLLALLGLTAGLRPLIRLRDAVADRQAMQLEPVPIDHRLPAELRPIVEAINLCIARLKLHVAMQRQFITDAAHQLRTPLAVLDTQIQCAEQAQEATAQTRQAFGAMRRTSRRMGSMTSQLLLLAQAESVSPALMRGKVDLGAVVSGVLEELALAAHRRDIDLGADLGDEPEGRLWVAGNGDLLAALLTNLVDNAIRYIGAGGRITVRCRRKGSKGGSVALRVIDDGPGIPAQARAQVFERFYRAAPHVEGSGLGLAIVRQIVIAHGGQVRLGASAGGAGLAVTVRLPAWREREEA